MLASIEEETEPMGGLLSQNELYYGYVPANMDLGSKSGFPDLMEEKAHPIMGIPPL